MEEREPEREQEYENDLKIDPHRLHEEWLKHSSLCMKYVVLAAEAQAAYERKKEAFDITKAEGKESVETIRAQLDLDIRKNPEKFDTPKDAKGTHKTTDSIVSSTILNHSAYKETVEDVAENRRKAHEEMIKAGLHRDLIKGAADTFSYQRKAALEQAVQLWMQEYFSTPGLPHEDFKNEAINQTENKIRQHGRRRTRT
jgi:hypothetical protein